MNIDTINGKGQGILQNFSLEDCYLNNISGNMTNINLTGLENNGKKPIIDKYRIENSIIKFGKPLLHEVLTLSNITNSWTIFIGWKDIGWTSHIGANTNNTIGFSTKSQDIIGRMFFLNCYINSEHLVYAWAIPFSTSDNQQPEIKIENTYLTITITNNYDNKVELEYSYTKWSDFSYNASFSLVVF